MCQKLQKAPVFIFQNDDENNEDFSELEQPNEFDKFDEFKELGYFPCTIKEKFTFIARIQEEEDMLFLCGFKKTETETEMSISKIAVIFPPLLLDQFQNIIFRLFSKYKYYN